jgi:hypothetical protein
VEKILATVIPEVCSFLVLRSGLHANQSCGSRKVYTLRVVEGKPERERRAADPEAPIGKLRKLPAVVDRRGTARRGACALDPTHTSCTQILAEIV